MEWTEVLGAVVVTVGLVIGIAKVWVKFTKTKKDDEIVAEIEKVFEKFSKSDSSKDS